MSMRKPAAEAPKAPAQPPKAPKKSDVARIIKRGGSVAGAATDDDKKSVQLRVESALLERIDGVRETVPSSIRASRHTWMMEAILEKLEREEQ